MSTIVHSLGKRRTTSSGSRTSSRRMRRRIPARSVSVRPPPIPSRSCWEQACVSAKRADFAGNTLNSKEVSSAFTAPRRKGRAVASTFRSGSSRGCARVALAWAQTATCSLLRPGSDSEHIWDQSNCSHAVRKLLNDAGTAWAIPQQLPSHCCHEPGRSRGSAGQDR